MKMNIKNLPTVLLICGFLSAITDLSADSRVEVLDFDPFQWFDSFQAISFRLSHVPDPSKGRLAFFIGSQDVTALMKPLKPGVFRYQAQMMPLPAGENDFNIYLVHDNNEWTELNSMTLRVLTSGGFEESEIKPQLEISDAFQSAKSHSISSEAEAQKSDWESHNEVSLQGSLSTHHLRKSIEIQSNWNFTGSSVQEQALRFAEKGDDAAKIDLSDYLIEIRKEGATVQMGHVAYGSHQLLMDNVSNRGLTASWRAFKRFDMSLSAQNGQSITGATNLLGFDDYSHNRINGLGLGVDLLNDSESRLRVELTYLDAKITAEDNFNDGSVTDAAMSNGLGLQITGNSASGRLRGNIAYARSTFQNPPDPFLEQDFELLESTETTDSSQSVNIEYDVLQPSYEEGSTDISLTAGFTHRMTDPLYNTAGAFVTPDLQEKGLQLTGQLGDAGWQLQYNRTRDNLDDIETVLTTLNRNTLFSVSFPFRSLIESTVSWIPENISINYQKNHQFGDNLPPTFDADSHIPDQVTLQKTLGLEWLIGQTSITYNLTSSDQDNRQPGREDADFINTDQSVSLNTSLNENLSVNFSISHSVAEDIEQLLDRTTNSYSLAVDWMITHLLSLSMIFNTTDESDSSGLQDLDSHSAQAQLSYSFHLAGGRSGKIPVQFFIRYASDKNNTVDNQFQFSSSTENQTINTGLTISFF